MDLTPILSTDKIFSDITVIPFLINFALAAGLSWLLSKHYDDLVGVPLIVFVFRVHFCLLRSVFCF